MLVFPLPTSFNVFYVFGSLLQLPHLLWASPPPGPGKGGNGKVPSSQEPKRVKDIL